MRQKITQNIEHHYQILNDRFPPVFEKQEMSHHMTAKIILLVGNMPEPKHQQNTVKNYTARKLTITETQIKHYFEKLNETMCCQYILEYN